MPTLASRSITLHVRDYIYAVEVVDAKTLETLPVAEIESRIWSCVRDVVGKDQASSKALKVGVLTSDGRDEWSDVSSNFHWLYISIPVV